MPDVLVIIITTMLEFSDQYMYVHYLAYHDAINLKGLLQLVSSLSQAFRIHMALFM